MRFCILSLIIALAGCVDSEATAQEKYITTGLQGGFYPDENLEALGSYMLRSGIVRETGDRYIYYRDIDNAEIINAEIISMAPSRPNWLIRCSVDSMSDRKTCRINMIPPGLYGGGPF